MTLKTMISTIAAISGIVGLVSVTGCSMNSNLVKERDVKVETVNSSNVTITRAYLQTTKTPMELRRELKRRYSGRGPIPGHLHIELIGSDGVTFKEADVGYKRNRSKSRYAKFYLPIPNDLTKISAVRVIHHGTRSHIADSTKSLWRDVNQTK